MLARLAWRRRFHWRRAALAAGLLAVGLISYAGIRVSDHLPSVAHLVSRYEASPTSLVYDSSGKVIARLGGPKKTVVPLTAVAPDMREAVIAVEDHTFYHNPGFDLRSMARAAYVDLIHRRAVQGASTITEQLAKDLYLSDQKSISRKIQEFLIGLELSSHYRKNEILDMYLNAVYFGQGADGIKSAAHVYFDSTPSHLTMAQATLLAGLPQAPSLYDPLINPQLAKQRQAEVVQSMVRYKDISPAQGRRIMKAPWHLHPQPAVSHDDNYPYPWYIDQVVNELLRQGFSMSQIMHGGLAIHTALRPRVYDAAQIAVDQWMNKNFGASKALYPDHQAAAVVENPKNGHVWAIIGGRRHFTFLQDDLAVNALRSTGSAIKPLLDYAPAIVQGDTQMSVVQDVPLFHNVNGQAWWPSNDDSIYRGYLDLRDALAISDNDAAVHLLNQLGVANAARFLQSRFGIAIPKAQSQNLSVALGVDTNLLDLTSGYAALDNQGQRRQPVFVTRVALHGQTLFQPASSPAEALTPDQSFILTDMLRRVLDPNPLPAIGPNAYATGHALGIGRPAAAKSGTNNNEADAWFMGYEPQMTVGVWEGDRLGEIAQPYTNSGSGPAYGDVAAGPIWRQIMTSVNAALKLKPEAFPHPAGLTYVKRISITSGDRPSPFTPPGEVQGAWFVNGTVPTTVDPTWKKVRLSAADPGSLWRPGCGPFVTAAVLKRETDWHPGVPRPWDAIQWAPQTTCTPQSASHSQKSSHQRGPKHRSAHAHHHHRH